jgi:hypothetical protein
MAIHTTTPEDGFDSLGVNLAISPMWGEQSIGCSVAMRLTPYRVNEDGTIERNEDGAKAVVFGDAFTAAQSDPALAACVQAIQDALQAFITAKGL